MKRALSILALLICTALIVWGQGYTVMPPPTGGTLTDIGGGYYRFNTAASSPWGPEYDSTVLLHDYATTNNPTLDDSFIGTNVGYLAAGAATPTFVAAAHNIGAHYSFDGGDYINCGNSADFQFNDVISVYAWYRCGGSPAVTHFIVAKDLIAGTTNTRCWAMYTDGSGYADMQAYVNGVDKRANGTVNINFGGWHQIVGTFDGANVKSYLDLRTPTTTAAAGTLNISAANIGVGWRDAGQPDYAVGDIDKPTIYHKALTADDIAELYWLNGTNHGVDLYDYNNHGASDEWQNSYFLHTFDYDFIASMGYQKNGTERFTKAGGGDVPTFQSDALNGWFDYDGTDYCTSSSAFGNGWTNITIMCWNKLDSSTDYAPLIVCRGTTYNSLSQWDAASAKYAFAVNNTRIYAPNNSAAPGTWRHVVGTWQSGGFLKLYVDGVEEASGTYTGALIIDDVWRLMYDDFSIARKSNGQLDEVRFYNQQVSSNRVFKIYNDTKYKFGL